MNENGNDYIPVYSANGKLAAEMIRLMLEAHGIPAIISQESIGESYGLTMTPLGETRILVHPSRVEEAEQILRDMEAGKLETPEDLSGGESVEDGEGE